MLRDFGKEIRKRRVELGLTLREFSSKVEVDPGNMSKIERGKMAPPRQFVVRLAEHLGFAKQSEEYEEFLDRGAIAAGKIPEDILDDSELLQKLAPLFREMRRNPGVDPFEQMKQFIQEV